MTSVAFPSLSSQYESLHVHQTFMDADSGGARNEAQGGLFCIIKQINMFTSAQCLTDQIYFEGSILCKDIEMTFYTYDMACLASDSEWQWVVSLQISKSQHILGIQSGPRGGHGPRWPIHSSASVHNNEICFTFTESLNLLATNF